jgi:hypothetical protein
LNLLIIMFLVRCPFLVRLQSLAGAVA